MTKHSKKSVPDTSYPYRNFKSERDKERFKARKKGTAYAAYHIDPPLYADVLQRCENDIELADAYMDGFNSCTLSEQARLINRQKRKLKTGFDPETVFVEPVNLASTTPAQMTHQPTNAHFEREVPVADLLDQLTSPILPTELTEERPDSACSEISSVSTLSSEGLPSFATLIEKANIANQDLAIIQQAQQSLLQSWAQLNVHLQMVRNQQAMTFQYGAPQQNLHTLADLSITLDEQHKPQPMKRS